MTKEPVAAIVVAAGSGVRLGTSTAGGTGPKALRTVQGKTLVAWSVAAMAAGGATCAIVVMPAGARELFEQALADAPIPVTLVEGGATRQESVYRGIAALPSRRCHIVLVHDAARP
ncbi:MAG: IspD/TarI family cytidylyltransferase, partial [Propionibacteriaceae bacterium]